MTKRDKHFLLFILFFSIIISFVEMLGISVIMPFMSIASDFELIHSNQYYRYFYELFSFESPVTFIMAFGVVLFVFYIFRSIINLIYFYLLARFSHGRYHLVAFRLFQNYLGLSYKDFVQRNSSYLTKNIVSEANHLTHLITSIMLMYSEFFVLLLIYAMLLYVNWKITLILTLILAVNGIFLTKTVSKKIKKAGSARSSNQKKFYEVINSSFGNFKMIKLLSSEMQILNSFSKASYGYAKANITNIALGHIPRLFLEAIGFGLIALIVTYIVWKYEQDIRSIIPMVAMFIIALYRLLPSVNRLFYSYNTIIYYSKALDIIHNELMYDIEDLGDEQIDFEKAIVLAGVSFGYSEDRPILEDIHLEIGKNQKIAIIGESGAGKSTLVDIIIGLYKPLGGSITIDSRTLNEENVKSWREKIGYIPQAVYLFDGTVADNVAFGRGVDEERVVEVLKKAKLYDFLQTNEGLDTIVGEGGIQLSGGQKQRIAIARALYGESDLLILDEATSALDNETEAKIMDEIFDICTNKTLIIIAHRKTSLEKCDFIYKVEKGKVSKTTL